MKTWTTKSGCCLTRILGGRSNVFLVSRGGKHLLVDTSPARRWKKLDRRLRRLGVARLEALILTHAHYDHAGGAARLRDKYRALVFIHREEAAFLAGGESPPIGGTTVATRFLVERLAGGFGRFAVYDSCRPDVLVEGEMRLDDRGFGARLLPTPGHTPGSMSLIVDEEIALVGDAMFGIFPGSIVPPFAADAGRMIESWGRLLDSPCRLYLPSHGSANSRRLVRRAYRKRKGILRKPD